MTSLLRLIGDSNISNSEVRNTFREPLIIKENSRIALVGMNAMLENDIAPEVDYVIDATNSQFKYGIVNDAGSGLVYGNIPLGTYSRSQFIRELNIAMNYPVVNPETEPVLQDQDRCLGLYNAVSIVNGKIQITTRKALYESPDLSDGITDGLWIVIDEPPSVVGNDSFTATVTADKTTSIVSFGGVPLVSSAISATFVNPETVDMGLFAINITDESEIYWGIHVVSGVYHFKTLTDDVVVTIGTEPVEATDGDVIEMFQYGGKVVLRIGDKPLINLVGVVSRSDINPNDHSIVWQLVAASGGQMSDILLTDLEGVNPPAVGLGGEEDVIAGIQFRNALGTQTKLLSSYMGFPGDYDVIQYRPLVKNSPAILVAVTDPTGIPAISSIIITIEGLGLLKSVDGSNVSKAPSNIVYAVHKLKDIGQFLQIDVPTPIYLGLNNSKPINVNELRVRMLEASGYNPLKFIGKPSFTFVIA